MRPEWIVDAAKKLGRFEAQARAAREFSLDTKERLEKLDAKIKVMRGFVKRAEEENPK